MSNGQAELLSHALVREYLVRRGYRKALGELDAARPVSAGDITSRADIAQSLPLCILLSALGGAIEVAATAVLAHREADERKTGKEWGKVAQLMALGCNVALQLVSSIVGNLFSTWYGPVSRQHFAQKYF